MIRVGLLCLAALALFLLPALGDPDPVQPPDGGPPDGGAPDVDGPKDEAPKEKAAPPEPPPVEEMSFEDQLRMASTFTARGDHADALEVVSRLIRERPDSLPAQIAYQDLRLASGELKDLIKVYADLAKVPDAGPDAIYLHARLLEGSKSITLLKKVLKAAPRHFAALCLIGCRYVEAGKTRDALKSLEAACQVNPASAVPWCFLGWFEETRDDREKAEEYYRNAIQADPEHAVSHLNLGVLLLETDRFVEAEIEIDKAAKYASGSPMPLLAKGRMLTRQEDDEGALALYQQAVEMPTNTFASLNMLGSAHTRLGNFGLARQAFSRALQLVEDDDSVPTLLSLCHLCMREGAPEKAQNWIRQALKADSKSADAYFFDGMCHGDLGKNKAAEKSLLRATKLDDENVVFLRALGTHYCTLGKWKEAIRTLTKASDLDEESNRSLLDLAFAYSGAGDARRAATLFETVVEDDPEELSAWLNLGLLYKEKLRKPKEAVEAFNSYLDYGGEDKRVEDWLEELKTAR